MNVPKIHLSSTETELMQNAEIILTKNRVLEKIRTLLEEVQEKQTDFVRKRSLANDIFTVPAKISKGENYLGLPYLILDYPRQSFEKHFFFIRTMFWWGHFFSCTLHLAGQSKKIYTERIKQAYEQLSDYYISTSDDQWLHHLKEPNYHKIGSMTKEQFEQSCENFDHIKIAGKYSLPEWEKAPSELYANWKFFLDLCGSIS